MGSGQGHQPIPQGSIRGLRSLSLVPWQPQVLPPAVSSTVGHRLGLGPGVHRGPTLV